MPMPCISPPVCAVRVLPRELNTPYPSTSSAIASASIATDRPRMDRGVVLDVSIMCLPESAENGCAYRTVCHKRSTQSPQSPQRFLPTTKLTKLTKDTKLTNPQKSRRLRDRKSTRLNSSHR